MPTAFNNSPIREHANEVDRYYDHDINAGGPVKKDKIWFFGTYRKQFNAVAQPNFQFDKTFDTTLWNAVGKVSYQANQKNKLTGYYQWGQKVQPNRLPFATYTYASPEQTWTQDSGSWVYKGEWNGTISDKLYLEGRYGDFGYYFPLFSNSSENYFFHDTGQLYSLGAHQKQQLDRDRKQFNLAATYFLDTAAGSHTFKMGAELLKEQSWEGYESRRGGSSGIEHIYNNGVSSQVIFGIPTASCAVASLSAHDCLTARSALDQLSAFVNDTWAKGKMTINAGVRIDQYKGFLPEQEQLAGRSGPVSVAAVTFPETDFYTWNVFAPRIGAICDLTGDGKMVIKANYGLYWHNPGVGPGSNANPNTPAKSQTHTWNDRAVCAGCISGDRRWQSGEESALPTSAALQGAVGIDPNLKAPYTHEASVWLERQISDTMGVRAGFVYKTEEDLISTNLQPGRPASAYTVPFNFVDIGVDGIRGTGDDRNLTFYGFPTANSAQFPSTTIVSNFDQYSRYKTIELSMNKRYGNKWSATVGGGYTLSHDFPNGFPQNPAQPGVEDRTNWGFKASGSYDAPWGVRLTPILRHQSGVNYARTITISVPAGSAFSASGTHYVEPSDSNREDNILVVDVRAEKSININSRVRIRAYLDAFNLSNSHASETIARATGPQYQKPALILAPRTLRLGFRFIF